MDKPTNPLYATARWKRLAKSIKQRQPYCCLCLFGGKVGFSQCVDHVDGNTDNNKDENLQGLCYSCHNWKSARIERDNEEHRPIIEALFPTLVGRNNIHAECRTLYACIHGTNLNDPNSIKDWLVVHNAQNYLTIIEQNLYKPSQHCIESYNRVLTLYQIERQLNFKW